MIFRLSFKTPDVLDYTLEDYPEYQNEIKALAEKFIEYGECISIEFDTDAGTATVIPVK